MLDFSEHYEYARRLGGVWTDRMKKQAVDEFKTKGQKLTMGEFTKSIGATATLDNG